ncbi:diaminopimelate epimerase [Azospirillum thiophilum]|uniref:Diaminopimelate epimerase n=1 Tax=Azospirillum thiophilum TaxID=528244 RepID=A0AAC8VU92_9PROT|nr:diaminopimelate epimerase [Azospirillum thiophilum]ALG69643.1 diaminopimelate epimerase [Azospirillum thiophilum]KJR66680.1 diaminopimelate epimerase [Azospirillum thiophilum]
MTREFLKMHGLGNDFVVIDARSEPYRPSGAEVRAIADRKTGVGCDQFIILEHTDAPGADAFMRIHNADGSEVGACGNASRCVGWLLMTESGRDRTSFQTEAGLLHASRADNGRITVDMGAPRLDWAAIPLATPTDTLRVETVEHGGFAAPVAVSMGNPHAVFFVDDAEAVPLTEVGPVFENHPAFPERANIEFAQVLSPTAIRMRVWERGAGITQACGTGACATLVAAARRGLTGRKADILLDGGTLTIEWTGEDRVLMTGPVALSFSGRLSAELASA